jgi:magnesium chelatase family protein
MVLELVKYPDCRFILPSDNADEAALVPEVNASPAVSLQQLAEALCGVAELNPAENTGVSPAKKPFLFSDFAEVKGQETSKRALQVAAAGRHNILLIGPPGGGKTMLARRMPSIMPPMTREEILETTKIYSVAGLLNSKHPLIEICPFRSPHKNASAASIIGGGRTPHPGEISLSHHGILFLDEMPEFTRDVLEALRQPLEDRVITVARAAATYTYPADFMLIGAMNPCPCGNYGSDKACNCSPLQIQKYLKRISGPLLDRLDLHVEVPRVKYDQLSSPVSQLDSTTMRESIIEARKIQQTRFKKSGISRNSQMQTNQIRKYCTLDSASEEMLRVAFERLQMSARSYTRVLKISRTIADLNGEEQIAMQHLAEALQYRSLDKKYWPH